MEIGAEALSMVKRKIVVCAEHNCFRCKGDTIGNGCKWLILHALETQTEGESERPRQSGKSGEICAIANRIAVAGYKVVVVTETEGMAEHFRERWQPLDGVEVVSVGLFWHWMVGRSNLFVLLDDVLPGYKKKELICVCKGSGHQIVADFYTNSYFGD
jgi:hypothetical protein